MLMTLSGLQEMLAVGLPVIVLANRQQRFEHSEFQSSGVAVVSTASVSRASDFSRTVSGKGMLPLCGVGWCDLKCHHRSAHTHAHREEAVIKKEGIQRTKYST